MDTSPHVLVCVWEYMIYCAFYITWIIRTKTDAQNKELTCENKIP